MPAKTIRISGIVAMRNRQPYLVISTTEHGRIAQLTMADARNIARDIERMCARTEADAMIHKFFSDAGFPPGSNDALMIDFRAFRSALDAEPVERSESDPEEPPL